METIKFKLYDKETNESELWNWEGLSDVDMLGFSPECYNVCQFTGLTDKHGVDIYEGDITKGGRNGNQGVVKFYEDGGYFDLDIGYIENQDSEKDDIEVIGNIYQNPNLTSNH